MLIHKHMEKSSIIVLKNADHTLAGKKNKTLNLI